MKTKKMVAILESFKRNALFTYVINDIVVASRMYTGTPYERVMARLNDVTRGLSTGIVPNLIYTKKLTSFYNSFELQIKELVKENAIDIGVSVQRYLDGLNGWDAEDCFIDGDSNKALLSRWAYETIAFYIKSCLESLDY